jgi:hypothetical protein
VAPGSAAHPIHQTRINPEERGPAVAAAGQTGHGPSPGQGQWGGGPPTYTDGHVKDWSPAVIGGYSAARGPIMTPAGLLSQEGAQGARDESADRLAPAVDIAK